MIWNILTLFPDVIELYTMSGVIGKARERGLLDVRAVQIREFATDKHRTVDDYTYGGGAGMIMKPDVTFRAIEYVKSRSGNESMPVILTAAQGRRFTHKIAEELSRHEELCILCGHYGGVDERVRRHMVTDEISIGDYVVTGGELPALVMIDAVSRLLPDVLGNEDSPKKDSFADGLLGEPVYTRPPDFQGWKVPQTLMGGNHAEIESWRREQKLRETFERRPELLERIELSETDIRFLETIGYTGKEN